MHSIVSYSKCNAVITSAPSRMPALIAEFQRLTTMLDAIDHFADPLGWDAVATARCRALEALLDEKPTSIAEFATKFEALLEFTEEDTGLTVLRILAEDIRYLAEA